MDLQTKSREDLLTDYYSIKDRFNHNRLKIKRAYKFGNDREAFELIEDNLAREAKLWNLEKILKQRFDLEPFHFQRVKQINHRSEFARSWAKYLSSGSLKFDISYQLTEKQRAFNWQIFGTLTAGFENFSAKACRRLTEKYFERLCDAYGHKHPVKFFFVIEKFKTKMYEKDRYHIHYLLDCPESVADIDFRHYLDDIKLNNDTFYPPHKIWQDLCGRKPEIFGRDKWADIINGSVPKTARYHRVRFDRIHKDTDDYNKAISYIVKYMCKEGKGVPHWGLLSSQTLIRQRYRELTQETDDRRRHLESFGCQKFTDFTDNDGVDYELYFKSDKWDRKSKSKHNYIVDGDIVAFRTQGSLESFTEVSPYTISDAPDDTGIPSQDGQCPSEPNGEKEYQLRFNLDDSSSN